MVYPHFTDEETEDYKDLETCIGSQGNLSGGIRIPNSDLPVF